MSFPESIAKSAAFKTNSLRLERMNQTRRMMRHLWVWTAIVFVSMQALAWFYSADSTLRDFERKITWEMKFKLRDSFGRGAKMDPRLRILMFDDSTVQILKRAELGLNEWAELLVYIDKHKPAHVYIDKIFGLLNDNPEVVDTAIHDLSQLQNPVAVGSFTTSLQIPGRDRLDIDSPQFNVKKYLSETGSHLSEDEAKRILERASLKDRTRAFRYGPIPQLQKIFLQGHIDYPVSNHIYPAYRTGEQTVLPSLSLTSNLGLKVTPEGLLINGQPVPRTTEGTLLINWLNPAQVYANASSFAGAFDAVQTKPRWDYLKENSHVLVLPLAFTGNTDFKESPYGSLPAGLILASMINSALTNQWISETPNVGLVMVLLIFAAAALQLVKGFKSWALLFLGSVLIAAFGLHQFVFESHDFPWLAGEIFFGITGTLLLSFRSLWESRTDKLILRLEEDFERLEREEQRLAKEMKDAARIAAALAPEDVPLWQGFEVSAFHRSVSEVSGDWYFFEKSPTGRFFHLVLCDISGHGVQAALVVSGCKSVLSMLRLAKPDSFDSENFLHEYAVQLNKVLHMNGNGNHSATLVGVTYDVKEERLHHINCGHPFPIIHSKDAESIDVLISVPGDPIGYNPELNTKVTSIPFHAGSSVIVHSDGVSMTRMKGVLKKWFADCANSPIQTAEHLFKAVQSQTRKDQTDTPNDDVSLIVIRKRE